jgi:hypothetical protein
MNTEEITTVTRNLTETLCLPAWRRLASDVNALFIGLPSMRQFPMLMVAFSKDVAMPLMEILIWRRW